MMSVDQVSPFLLADLEGCVQTFSKDGEGLVAQALMHVENIRSKMNQMKNVIIAQIDGVLMDPMKIVF
jgi:uncharacterized surface protein with fasciclin (FAS1) repeats